MLKQNNIELGYMDYREKELIHLIRTKYRFGSIEILVRDGLPVDILRTVERKRLGEGYTQD